MQDILAEWQKGYVRNREGVAARVCQQNIQRPCAVGSEVWYCPRVAS